MVANVILHLGAHKTASTHFARLLRRNGSACDKAGLARPRKEIIRRILTPSLSLPGRVVETQFVESTVLQQLKSDHKRVVISEENIIGNCKALLGSNGFYPRARKRLKNALKILNADDFAVFLAIRNPATFVVSAYGETIRSHGYMDFKEYLNDTELTKLRWTKLLRVIKEEIGDTPIYVWTFENYDVNKSKLLELVLNLNDETKLNLESNNQLVRVGLSGRAIEEMCRKEIDVGKKLSQDEIDKIMEEYPKSDEFPAPDYWTEDQRLLLNKSYQKDIRQIQKLPGVQFLF